MNAAPQTFSLKQLRFTFTLSNNAVFPGSGPKLSNVLTISGLRASIRIKGSGLPAFPEAELQVYGMLQSDMNALTGLANIPLNMERNTVVVEANSGQGWSTVFAGQIITSGPSYDDAPNVSLNILARVLGFESLAPALSVSYTGATNVAEIISNIAARMGRAFENNGVAVYLNNPYLAGTLTQQLRTIAKHAGIDVYVPADQNVVAICPHGVPRNQLGETWLLSPASGLVGYPKLDYQRGFVNVRSVFNAAFRFGGKIAVRGSSIPAANGDNWVVGTLSHHLESLTPGGAWFSDMLLYPAGLLPPSS